MKLNKKTGGGILGFVLIAAVIAVLFFSGNLQSFSLASTGQGITLIGLSNINVLSSYAGFAGPWWSATVALGGTQTLNIKSQQLTNGNSSLICDTNCQQQNAKISETYGYVLYKAKLSGTAISEYTVNALNFNKTYLTYQSCIGQFPGSTASQTTPTGQPVYFGGCSGGGLSSYQSYYDKCTGAGGLPLIYTRVPGFFNYVNAAVACYQVYGVPYAQVYGLNPAQFKYGVQACTSGSGSSCTSINDTMNSNTSNPNLLIYNIGNGFAQSAAPSETTVSLVSFTNSSNTYHIVGGSGTGLTSEVSSFYNGYSFSQQYTYYNATTNLNTVNRQIVAALTNSYVNTAFANSSVQLQNGALVGIKLPDPQGIYVRPVVNLLIKAASVGLYLGVSQMNITNIQTYNFKSGFDSTFLVTVKNNGGAQGGFTLTANPGATSTSFTPPSQSGTLSPGQTATQSFIINNNANVNANTSQQISFTVCPNPQGNLQCQTVKASYTLSPQCNLNINFNAGNCTPLVTTTVPGQSSASTTTIPCNPQTGEGCNIPPPPATPSNLWEYIVAAVVIIVVAGALLGSKRKKRGTR